jgi:hypothetical protein
MLFIVVWMVRLQSLLRCHVPVDTVYISLFRPCVYSTTVISPFNESGTSYSSGCTS